MDCGYSLEPPRQGGSNGYPQSMFCAEIWKLSEFLIWKFSFFSGGILQYIWISVFSYKDLQTKRKEKKKKKKSTHKKKKKKKKKKNTKTNNNIKQQTNK